MGVAKSTKANSPPGRALPGAMKREASAAPRRPSKSTQPAFEIDGNVLNLLVSGVERRAALLAMIAGAETSLRILYYIFCDDQVGREVRDAMVAAAARGVDVRLIVDGFGSDVPPTFFDGLRQAGGDVCQFLPRYGRRYLLRNHQKLVLADERRVLIGGFNVQDDYFDDKKGWRDLGLRLEGPAAKRLVPYFEALRRWTHQSRPSIRALRRMLARTGDARGGKVRWLLGGPTRRLSAWALDLKREMERADNVDIISAYFAPNPKMLRALEGIVARGGRARVITPSKSDHSIAVAAARHTFHRLLKRGVGVFEYAAQKLHTKLFVLDGSVQIGSANFDMRSLYLNLELMLRIEDPAFTDHVRAYFEGEIADSKHITAAAHAKAGWLDRLRWSAAYFMMAVVDTNITRRLNFGPDGK